MQDAIAILVSRGGLIGHAIYAPELEPLSSQDDSSLSDKGCSLNLHTWNLDIQLKKEKGIQQDLYLHFKNQARVLRSEQPKQRTMAKAQEQGLLNGADPDLS